MPCPYWHVTDVVIMVQETILLRFHGYIFHVMPRESLSGNKCPGHLYYTIFPPLLHLFSFSVARYFLSIHIEAVRGQ